MKAFAIITAAVGVALVSGLPDALVLRTYGSGPLRFEAAFPSAVGPPVLQQPDDGLLFALACSDTELVSLEAVDMSAVGSNRGGFFNASFCPLARLGVFLPGLAGGTASVTGGDSTLRTALVCKNFLLRPTRAVHLYQGGESVSGRDVDWDVELYGPTRQFVERFLRSFKPLPIVD